MRMIVEGELEKISVSVFSDLEIAYLKLGDIFKPE